MVSSDRIELTGIRCYGYTGALPEEQILGQWFEVSLGLWVDLQAVGQSDRLEDTLDYRPIIAKTRSILQHQRFTTIERLATAIADAILQPSSQSITIQQVHVHLTKVNPPIPDFAGQVAVSITRQNSNQSS
jgi:dihydroneopterin aldolase